MEPGGVFRQESQGLRLFFYGVHLALIGLKGHFNRHAAGARPNIPADSIGGKLQMGQGRRPDLPLGHGHRGAVLVAAPLKGLVGKPLGDNGFSRPFDQGHTEFMECLFRKSLGGAHSDFLLGIAQGLAYADLGLCQSGINQGPAQVLHPLLSPNQSKDPLVAAKLPGNVPVPSMKTHRGHILIGGSQFGTEGHQAGNARL